jgi:hypothetical protein
MSDVALPKIKVTDSQNLDGSALGTSGGVESPSTTTDGGQSARPRSATSSEGVYLQSLYCALFLSLVNLMALLR